MNPVRYLNSAALLSRVKDDNRTFCIGSIGIRSDKAVVGSYNGNPRFPDRMHHAEYRLSRKLTTGSVVFVARTLVTGDWALAKPCPDCFTRLLNIGTKRIYYTIAPNEYGVLVL